ncbi:hypothetical protein H4Q26_000492 [Puccinia striiformis f. sp. tritici PST-130]|nr:hypothetical protein H4Q26_000492 [Puccinia striiformis f. sp. tritici PST-130]
MSDSGDISINPSLPDEPDTDTDYVPPTSSPIEVFVEDDHHVGRMQANLALAEQRLSRRITTLDYLVYRLQRAEPAKPTKAPTEPMGPKDVIREAEGSATDAPVASTSQATTAEGRWSQWSVLGRPS